MPPALKACALCLPVSVPEQGGLGELLFPFTVSRRSRGQGLRAYMRLRPGGRL